MFHGIKKFRRGSQENQADCNSYGNNSAFQGRSKQKNTGECKYRIAADSAIDAPKGSFDIYLNGELYKSGIKYGVEFTFNVGDGSYDMKAVYRPADNDCYSIDDITTSFSVKLPKRFKAIGADGANNADGTAFEAMMSEGSTVMVTAAVSAKALLCV